MERRLALNNVIVIDYLLVSACSDMFYSSYTSYIHKIESIRLLFMVMFDVVEPARNSSCSRIHYNKHGFVFLDPLQLNESTPIEKKNYNKCNSAVI